MRLAATSLALLMLAGTALAKPWTVDPAKSSLGFETTFNGAKIEGRFNSWNAEIEFDPANLGAAHAKVTIDLNSAVTGDAARDKALPTASFFDTQGSANLSYAAPGPSGAVFETTLFRDKGNGAYEADGMLSMRGVAKPVTLAFTLTIDGDRALMDGTAILNRLDWGVGQGEYADEEPIATAVNITVHIDATSP